MSASLTLFFPTFPFDFLMFSGGSKGTFGRKRLICFSYFVVQLYEAHKQMNIEKLDKSLSYKSLESARKVAEEMQKQASDYAKVAGQERGN